MMRILFCLFALALSSTAGIAAEASPSNALSCDQGLPWLRVDGPLMRRESDQSIVMLRGINVRAHGLFDVSFDDGRLPLHEIPQFGPEDPALMRKAGFNFVRLPISWSGLEPQEGEFSSRYLAQLQTVVRQLNEVGIYVLIDFHQDAYSKEIGEDGAPAWAIVPSLKKKFAGGPLKNIESTARRIAPTTLLAFKSFFENKEDIQTRFWPAWRKVISTFQDCPGVVGFEPMNEPMAGHLINGDKLLQNFYDGALRELRSLDTRHSLWLGPDYFNFVFTRKGLRDEVFLDDQVVFAPHVYPNLNPLPGNQGGTDVKRWKKVIKRITDDYEDIRRSYGTRMMAIAEWGLGTDDAKAPAYAEATFELIYRRNYASAFWIWKEASHENWGYFAYNETAKTWQLKDHAMKNFSLPMVLQAPSADLQQSFDHKKGQLKVSLFELKNNSELVVYLPKHWFPFGVQLEIEKPEQPAKRMRLKSSDEDYYTLSSEELQDFAGTALVFSPLSAP